MHIGADRELNQPVECHFGDSRDSFFGAPNICTDFWGRAKNNRCHGMVALASSQVVKSACIAKRGILREGECLSQLETEVKPN